MRLVDDIVIVSDDLGEAKGILQELIDVLQENGQTIHFGKIEVMSNMVPSDQIQIDKNRIELVDKYTSVTR